MSEVEKLEKVLQSEMDNIPKDLVLGYVLWLFKKKTPDEKLISEKTAEIR